MPQSEWPARCTWPTQPTGMPSMKSRASKPWLKALTNTLLTSSRSPQSARCTSGAADNRGMSPLTLGSLTVPVPVVLAPMAGITNAAYRRLCAEQGAGLYVCEMITSRGLVERDSTTLKMLVFDELSRPARSLYGTDPAYSANRDPLRRVRRRSRRPQLRLSRAQGDPQGWRGSAAVEARAVCSPRSCGWQAVAAATPYDVPVTMKTRKGLDDDHLTYLDAGRIAEEAGCAAIALHGRTVAQSSRPGRLGGDGAAGRASTSRSSATAATWRRATRCGWSTRPVPPGWSSAAAASGAPGCSATLPPPSPLRARRALCARHETR